MAGNLHRIIVVYALAARKIMLVEHHHAEGRVMRVAIEGCSHGCLDQIYASILELDRRDGRRTELLLLCGDVQTLRNPGDLHCLAVPDKYKQMGDFYRYYNGERTAPILTIMIGGNHEASNYLWELYYGGWVAPNIYYLGAAGCVDIGGMTICGISGIYKSHDYNLGRHERMPYNPGSVRSIYHTRIYDAFRVKLLGRMRSAGQTPAKPTVVLSHDWPNTIEQHGDVSWLTWKKSFFKQEVQSQTLGSPPLMEILHELKPIYWFAAHLHVRFAALFKHDGNPTHTSKRDRNGPSISSNNNTEEITIDDDDGDVDDMSRKGEAETCPSTRFLALSKCLEGQDFLQILEIGSGTAVAQGNGSVDPYLTYNPVWLAILRTTERYLSLERAQPRLPYMDDGPLLAELSSSLAWVKEHVVDQGLLDVSKTQTFVATAPRFQGGNPFQPPMPPPWYTNPQTVGLCSLLQIPNKINPPPEFLSARLPDAMQLAEDAAGEAEEIRRIEEAAKVAMERKTASALPASQAWAGSEEINVTLSDEEDEGAARWKEGTG